MTLHAFSPDSIESEQVLLVCTALKGLMSSHGWNRRAWFLRPPCLPTLYVYGNNGFDHHAPCLHPINISVQFHCYVGPVLPIMNATLYLSALFPLKVPSSPPHPPSFPAHPPMHNKLSDLTSTGNLAGGILVWQHEV